MSSTSSEADLADRLSEFDEFYQRKLKLKLFDKYGNENESFKKVNRRFEQMIDYNVPHGKKLRGLCAYASLMILIGSDNCPVSYERERLIDQAKAVGWCIEFLQASFLVADDIMDNSTYRRGNLCWYLKEDVGSMAINDSFFLLSSVFTIINEYLTDHPMYSKFYEIFSLTLNNTVIGQGLDLITPPKRIDQQNFDFTNYTEEQYETIVKWKTAFYSFCLPVQLALYLGCIDNQRVHDKCKEILIEMGNFFQIQDDFLDCYGDPKVTGKVGTDIEEAKCSWLIVQALKKCNNEQRQILEKTYGSKDKSNVDEVKKIFEQLELKREYEQFESQTYAKIAHDIENISFSDSNLSDSQVKQIKFILKAYAKKIFKRNK